MAIEVLLFDVGGVLLTNGWDRHSRREACRRFDLDWEDFQDRHDFVADRFETGEMDLDEYLDRTIFYRSRPFGREAFFDYMKRQSQPIEATLALVARLTATGRFLLATLNNESRALNDYRIAQFGLRDHFSLFLSSCYLGVRKPEPEIFRMAVDITQHRPEECVFVDDRSLNLECADLAGIRPLQFHDADRLEDDLAAMGVTA